MWSQRIDTDFPIPFSSFFSPPPPFPHLHLQLLLLLLLLLLRMSFHQTEGLPNISPLPEVSFSWRNAKGLLNPLSEALREDAFQISAAPLTLAAPASEQFHMMECPSQGHWMLLEVRPGDLFAINFLLCFHTLKRLPFYLFLPGSLAFFLQGGWERVTLPDSVTLLTTHCTSLTKWNFFQQRFFSLPSLSL